MSIQQSTILWAVSLNLILLFSLFTPAFANPPVVNQTINCVDPPADLVAWWPLDESDGPTAFDIVGRNHGKYVNELDPTTGHVEGGLLFNGIDQYLLISDSSELNIGTGDFTIAGWIRTTASQGTIVSKWGTNADTQTDAGYALTLSQGSTGGSLLTLQLGDTGGNNRYFAVDSINLSDGEWHYIAAVVSRGERLSKQNVGRLYVDGQIVHTFDPSAQQGSLDNETLLTIGGIRSSDENRGRFFNGLMDEVTFFKRALEPEEIKQIYTANSLGICKESRTQQSEISGHVWLDENRNGLREKNEQGVSNISVFLLMGEDTEDDVVNTTMTDANGAYLFSQLIPEQPYSIEFEISTDIHFSPQDVGQDDAVDSDVDPTTGRIESLIVLPNETLVIDAGLQKENRTISGTVWQDQNNNGLQDDEEQGLADRVLLLQDDRNNIFRATTDAAGNYQFTDLAVGPYTVMQIFQDSIIQTHPQEPFHSVTFGLEQTESNLRNDNVNFGIVKRERTESCSLNSDTLTQEGIGLLIQNRTEKDSRYRYVIKGYPGFVLSSSSNGTGIVDDTLISIPQRQNAYISVPLLALPEIAGKNAQYQVIVTNQERGHSFGCSGRFWRSDQVIIEPITQPLVDIVAGVPQTVTVAIRNPSEQDVVVELTIDGTYVVDEEELQTLRLNELAVGETLSTTLAISAGQTISYTLLAELLPNCPTAGASVTDPVLRSPSAECLDINKIDGIGQLVITLNIDGEPDASFASLLVSIGSNINGSSLDCVGVNLNLWARSTFMARHIQTPNAVGVISGFIWNDKGTAGVYDGLEDAVPGVVVICACASNPDIYITAITDENGQYEFFDLEVGQEYVIRVEPPSGTGLTLPNAGDDTIDSDANLVTGQSEPILLTENETKIDAGLIEGDINCDGLTNDGDGLWILQSDVGLRAKATTCPPAPPFTADSPMNETVCDVNADDDCSAPDAVLILRCIIGKSNRLCPEEALDILQYNVRTDEINELSDNTSLEIPSQTIMPKTTFTVPVIVNVEESLGTAIIYVGYDSAQFQVESCQAFLENGLGLKDCNSSLNNQVRFSHFVTAGTTGRISLGEITFKHTGIAPITTSLTIDESSLRDVNGNPLSYTQMDGEISVGYWLYLPTVER